MRINSTEINRVQKRQIAEGLDALSERLSLDTDAVVADTVATHGKDGASYFMSGLSTGLDLGIELERARVAADHPEDNAHHDEFLESLPEAGYLGST